MNKRFNKPKRAKRKKKTDSDISQPIQDILISDLEDNLTVASSNMEVVNKHFQEYYNMLHCVREEKQNDWESDISLPEFTSRLLTQVGNFVGKYFQSRDYVETDEDSADPRVLSEAKAAKSLLNTILNDPNAHYFHKIVRLLMFTWPSGWGVIKGGYTQKVEKYVVSDKITSSPVLNETGEQLAEDGGIYESPLQKPMMEEIREPIYDYRILEDKPTFDVYPNQNVYFSPEYVYSLNDKEYVIFEDESMSLDKLRSVAEYNGYFNLDLLEDLKEPIESQKGGKKTWNKDGDFQEIPNAPSPKYRVLEF